MRSLIGVKGSSFIKFPSPSVIGYIEISSPFNWCLLQAFKFSKQTLNLPTASSDTTQRSKRVPWKCKWKFFLILKHTKNKGFCLVYFERAARRVRLTHKASVNNCVCHSRNIIELQRLVSITCRELSCELRVIRPQCLRAYFLARPTTFLGSNVCAGTCSIQPHLLGNQLQVMRAARTPPDGWGFLGWFL
jgi:hypothetical protein